MKRGEFGRVLGVGVLRKRRTRSRGTSSGVLAMVVDERTRCFYDRIVHLDLDAKAMLRARACGLFKCV